MKHTFLIRDESIRDKVIEEIALIPFEPLHEILIKPHSLDRTLAQNSLYWKWMTELGGELGDTKDAMHIKYKKMFLVSIFERDDPDYAAMIEAVRTVHRNGMKIEAKQLSDKIIELTSTTQANVKQFAEYLTDIEHDAAGLQIALTHPVDKYYLAMGIRRTKHDPKGDK